MEEGVALGGFRALAEKADGRDLEDFSRKSLGPLFGRRERRTGHSGTRPENQALQATLNDAGQRSFGQGWTPLKEDGWLGPKTRSAFGRVARATGADELTNRFGRSLGFF